MKFNNKLVLYSALIVILTVLIIPYSYSDGLRYRFGYPFAFFTTYDIPLKSNKILLAKININEFIFMVDVIAVYLSVVTLFYIIQKIKKLIKN